MTHPTDLPAAPKGVRERTRDAIRSELSAAAMHLFQEEGYAGTTVEAIAASVGVSGRTFFRYFASKEDAVLQPVEDLGRHAAARLLDRPARETPLQALRAAMDVAVEAVLRDVPLMRTVMQLNVENPELRRRHLQKTDEWIDDLAGALASRQGLTPTDPSVRLPCAIVLAAWELALRRCAEQDDFEVVAEALDAALAEAKQFLRR
ncbi:TetR/AcrR family transcriptional regulator [Kineococcus aurantiacus]|uniref:AcrR family transcriptional regulator n=1 Tax=Kineococcus aurantiacus TaxID=37633 RepID=A0A7Y9AR83_9ACTN|nr:TetR family transcriptional regulator [Kineococcus aurantiacus]NYD20507.1 AcrR family transcriptional regulator [Kineococcus aurantiacus]